MIKDLTPKRFRCYSGACPAVLQLDDGSLLIIGRTARCGDGKLDAVCGRVAQDETAVIIPHALLALVPRDDG